MSFNKVIVMGRLTRDPDARQAGSSNVAEFGIALDDGFGDNKKTCFIDVTAWGKTADFVSKYFGKGDPIHIEGRLSYDTWEDKNGGGKRSKHRITADRITFCEGAGKNSGGTPDVAAAGSQAGGQFNSPTDPLEIPF